MGNAGPTVSVVIPAYNAQDVIGRALASVRSQTFKDLEVLVVDDASSDATPMLVERESKADARLRLIRLEHNCGPAHARNIALHAARGSWIALLDTDDAWRPDRLQRMLTHSADADAVADNLAGYDAESGVETGVLFPVFPGGDFTVQSLLSPRAASSRYDFGYLKPILRREFLLAHRIAYDETLRTSEDLLFYLTLLLEGARVRLIDEDLYVYTEPVSAISGKSSVSSHSRPRDREVRQALARVLERYRGRLDGDAAASIERRITFLKRMAPVSEFYFARRRRDYGRMALLLARHASVQREAIGKLLRLMHR
jgi:succinoglycan biosynthesis protein ExoO